MTKAIAPQRASIATAAPTPIPADAPALNPPVLGLLLGLLELLLGDGVGDERAAEDAVDVVAEEELVLVLVEEDVVEAATAWPKFHPLIGMPSTNPPFGPTVVEVVNHGPVSVVIVR
jgi:hypothetical protein